MDVSEFKALLEILELQTHVSEHLTQFRDVLYECGYAWKGRSGFEDMGILYWSF